MRPPDDRISAAGDHAEPDPTPKCFKESAVDWVIPHQANIRIMEATMKKLGLPLERMISTVSLHANTSAASIPLALDVAVRDGRIQPGQNVMLLGVGGGFTWGSILLRWT